jgi:hypothetical protein
MLDHTENQQLHDLIVHVAPLLPSPIPSLPSTDPQGEEPAPPPLSAAKVERILDRVYNRLADEAEPFDPRLRKLLAETGSPNRANCPPFSAGKLRRILDRVCSRLAADTMVDPIHDETPARPALKAAVWAGLRAAVAAFFSPRPLPAPARSKLPSRRSVEPLLEGPRAD